MIIFIYSWFAELLSWWLINLCHLSIKCHKDQNPTDYRTFVFWSFRSHLLIFIIDAQPIEKFVCSEIFAARLHGDKRSMWAAFKLTNTNWLCCHTSAASSPWRHTADVLLWMRLNVIRRWLNWVWWDPHDVYCSHSRWRTLVPSSSSPLLL